MRTASLLGAVGALMLLNTAGSAATVTIDYNIVASGFTPYFNKSDPAAPFDPVDLNFTVTFDDSTSFGPTTDGLTVNSNTLPYPAEYSYNATYDRLTIGTEVSADASVIFDTADHFGTFIQGATSGTPTDGFFAYAPDSGTLYTTENVTIAVVPSMSTVPLPASAPMLGAALLAFGMIGYGLKRKGKAAA